MNIRSETYERSLPVTFGRSLQRRRTKTINKLVPRFHARFIMRKNPDMQCPTCGKTCQHGFAYLNHARVCVTVREYVEDAAARDDAESVDGEGQHDDDDGVDGEVEGMLVGVAKTIEAHLTFLDDAGTLDTSHVLQYLHWGTVRLSKEDLEVCRFLRSIEIGGGSSGVSTRASLDYVRSTGGRGTMLPRTVRSCWARVEKVRTVFVTIVTLIITMIMTYIATIMLMLITMNVTIITNVHYNDHRKRSLQ